MYKFNKFQFDWLKVFVATPEVGSLWKKQFAAGVTPQNQFSLNIYTNGKFRISTSQFSQVLGVGDSSLDIALAEFPTDELVIETPIEAPACRLCLSVDGGGKWERSRHLVASGQTFDLKADEIALLIPVSGWNGQGTPPAYAGKSFAPTEDCHVYLVRRL